LSESQEKMSILSLRWVVGRVPGVPELRQQKSIPPGRSGLAQY